MTAAPAIIHVESPYVVRNLRERLSKEVQAEIGFMENAADWPDYKYRQGKIMGLKEALTILDEFETRERRLNDPRKTS